ncbi:MAG: tRNA pseudouridine(38-40) synthase TruA [Terriglobales bacterium]
MRNLKLTLSYDGTEFHGWQVQPGRPTVQGLLTAAFLQVTGERVLVHGSGRTDAGTHALAQVANVHLENVLPAENLLRALNTRLPAAIRVQEVADVPLDFYARRAHSKLYRYRMYRDSVCPPFLRHFVYHFPYRLDEEAMIAAAPLFAGTHDFTSVAASLDAAQARRERRDLLPVGHRRTHNIRTLIRSELCRAGPELIYEVEGDGFLHHMVRNLMGVLQEVGQGKRTAADLPAILAAKNRRAAARTLPARGLYLVAVRYE